MGHEEVIAPPQSHIICDAPVAPAGVRVEAALIDCAIMLAPVLLGLVFFWYQGGVFSFDKHTAPFWLAAFCTIPVLYKLLWTHAGRDTIGMSAARPPGWSISTGIHPPASGAISAFSVALSVSWLRASAWYGRWLMRILSLGMIICRAPFPRSPRLKNNRAFQSCTACGLIPVLLGYA